MILVCPSCDSKFKVADNAIPPEGRKVRCAQCKHSWHATKANELKPLPAARPAPARPAAYAPPPVEEVDAGTAAQAAALRRSVIDEDERPEAPAAAEEDLFDEGTPEPVSSSFDAEADDFGLGAAIKDQLGEDFPLESDDDEGDEDEGDDDILARRRAELHREAERKSAARKRQMVVTGWALLLIVWLATLGALVFMKETVTATFPGTTQLYEFFASSRDVERFRPAEGERLTPPITETEVYVTADLIPGSTRVEVIDGVRQLIIVGELENTGNRAANVPKVEISIRDLNNQIRDTWVFDPPGLVLRRLSKLRFETMREVPYNVKAVEIRALEGTRSTNEAPSRI